MKTKTATYKKLIVFPKLNKNFTSFSCKLCMKFLQFFWPKNRRNANCGKSIIYANNSLAEVSQKQITDHIINTNQIKQRKSDFLNMFPCRFHSLHVFRIYLLYLLQSYSVWFFWCHFNFQTMIPWLKRRWHNF